MMPKLSFTAKATNNSDATPWDYAQRNEKLKGTKGYWALKDTQYNYPLQNLGNSFSQHQNNTFIPGLHQAFPNGTRQASLIIGWHKPCVYYRIFKLL